MKAGEEVFNPPPTVSIKAASPQPKSASPQPKAKAKSSASSSSGPAETETQAQAQAQPQAQPTNIDTKIAPSRIPDGLLVRILEEADKEEKLSIAESANVVKQLAAFKTSKGEAKTTLKKEMVAIYKRFREANKTVEAYYININKI